MQKNIPELFSKIVNEQSDKIAIKFEKEEISYRELDIRSNQVAHFLQKKGIKQGALVGIYMERCIETVICILGILKVGAAYLPLDPFHPMERNSYIIKDSKMDLLFVQEIFMEKINGIDQNIVCCIKDEKDNLVQQNVEKIDVDIEDDMTAYVIYTSGSTGFPKGVEIPHRAVSNLLLSMQERPGMIMEDRLLSVTTLSFDISVLEVFLPLIIGATLILANHETVLDGLKLSNLIEQEDITIMQATPVTWKILMEANWKGRKGLKILCGGEALSVQLAHQLIERCDSLWNMYGPTETTIWSSVAKITDPNVITLGEPILNTQFYVLDRDMKPVKNLEKGNLFIGGIGLAKGYLNNQELTDKKFIQNPLDVNAGKIYDTGDVVKRLEDGSIQYVGRADFQVKIRGFRIELGEIESMLEKNENVEQAVAIVKQDSMDNSIIVAYYKTNEETSNAKELKQWLKGKIPEYMIPSYFVKVDEYPLTGNNKIDRKALALVEHITKISEPVKEEKDIDTSKGSMEQELLAIWEDVLKIDDIEVTDDFFDLGGHSLLASRIVARVNPRYAVELTLLEFLTDGYTIELLSKLIEKKQEK